MLTMLWKEIAVNGNKERGRRSGPEAQTGYSAGALDELWAGAEPYFSMCFYDGALRKRTRELWRPVHYFFVFLMYIHLYPAKDNCVDILRTKKLAGVEYSFFFKVIMPLARNWNAAIDHIRWSDRLDPMNHHPYFPILTTVMWDTTCFRVQKPKDWTFGRYVVNGHYDFPCAYRHDLHRANRLCQQLSALDCICFPYFEDTHHKHPQFDWEMDIGDGHFGTCPNFFTPIFKKKVEGS